MSESASFLISLEEKISGSAKKGTSSLADLDAQIKKDSASLKTLEAAHKKLAAAGGASEERMTALKGAIDGKKASIADASGKIADLAGKESEAGEQAGFFSEKIAAMGGPVGIAIAVATALAAALAFVGAKLIGTALSTASAVRHQLNLATAMTGSKTAAKAMVDATHRISSSVALAGDKVQALGGSLMKSGLSGKQYETTLTNLAKTASVAGDEAAGAIKGVIEKSKQLGSFKIEGDVLKGTGLIAGDVYKTLAKQLGTSVKDVEAKLKSGKITADQGIAALNESMEQKFGALADSELLDFDTQVAKAKENFAGLFRDVNIEPFLQGLKSLLGLLDSNSATGKAMKAVLTGAMNGFFAAAGAALPYVKSFLLGIGIVALKFYTALKPAISSLREMMGIDTSGTSGGLETAANAGKKLASVIGTVVVVGVAIFAALAAVVYAVVSPFIEVGAAAYALYGSISGAMGEAMAYLSGLDFGAIASDLIDGLVAGIASGSGLVIQAISGLGSSAIGALKSTLGIASPSKVFKGLGGFTAEGFAGGVDAGASKVEKSVNHLVALPDVSALQPSNDNGRAGGAGGGASGGGTQITIEAGAFVINVDGSGKSPDEIEAMVERAVMKCLDKVAAQQGGPIADEEAA